MKKNRFLFQTLLPVIISCIIAIRFEWKWQIMILLFIILSGIATFVINKKEDKI